MTTEHPGGRTYAVLALDAPTSGLTTCALGTVMARSHHAARYVAKLCWPSPPVRASPQALCEPLLMHALARDGERLRAVPNASD